MVAWGLIFGLTALLIVVGLWLRSLLIELNWLADAIDAGRPLLVENKKPRARRRVIDRLSTNVNRLIAENRMRTQSEQGYLDQIRATLGSLQEAVLIVNADNHIVLANEAVRQVLRTPDLPVGKRLEGVVHGAEFFEYVRDVKTGKRAEVFVLEVQAQRQVLWLEVTGARLPDQGDGAGNLTLFVLHDVTQQKRLERVRTEFVANVSHELRTPVTVIKGFVDALIEDKAILSQAEQERFLRKIHNNVERLHQMLEELLMLSRLESNPDAIQRERHAFSQVVSEAAENFQMRIDPETQQLRLELTSEPDVVLLDPLRLSQVVENLLENALRHGRGLSRLTVRTMVLGQDVVCEVSDDGAGIPARDLPHIFERFYRGDKGRSRESGGTGLGLSIVKHIIQQHGGEIEAESVVGEGTTVRFRIPFPDALAERSVLSFARAQVRRSGKQPVE